MTETHISHIHEPQRSDLPDRQKIALQLAELYITNPEAITDSLFDEAKRHFSEAQIVEMLFFVGTYNMLHRFNTAIDLAPKDGENITVQSIRGYQETKPVEGKPRAAGQAASS
ncbi:MAG: hypothetical protein EXR49_02040 [Dehalococcoidia bacterium]|nr:hypothetical protein [Dehalococcoidia bacterium]